MWLGFNCKVKNIKLTKKGKMFYKGYLRPIVFLLFCDVMYYLLIKRKSEKERKIMIIGYFITLVGALFASNFGCTYNKWTLQLIVLSLVTAIAMIATGDLPNGIPGIILSLVFLVVFMGATPNLKAKETK